MPVEANVVPPGPVAPFQAVAPQTPLPSFVADAPSLPSLVSLPIRSFSFSEPSKGLVGQRISLTLPPPVLTMSATQPQVSMQPSRPKSLEPVQNRPVESLSANTCMAMPNCRRLFLQLALRAASRARDSAGSKRAI